MSFAAIRNTAYSALTTAQVKMSVSSSNIANADTAGYTQKIANQSATVLIGFSAGVTLTSVTSAADKYLLADIASALTALGFASVTNDYADSLQSLFGSVSGDDGTGTSLANTLASLETALSSLAGTPESATLKAQVVNAISSLVSQLRETSQGIQGLREEADGSIATSVKTVNQQLETIDALNKQIRLAAAQGESTADLEDQRNLALQAIAQQMDVNSYVTSDNQLKIYTSSGVALLDSSVHALSYTASGYVTDDTVFSAITVGGQDITGAITSGTIGGLLTMRDTTLTGVQDELDTLAQTLIETFNALYNSGTALPAPTTVTSATTLTEADTFAGTGTFRLATVDADGTLVDYTDFDLSSYGTIGDFVDAINATGTVTATINADGTLSLASVSGDGLAMADIDASVGGKGVSAYFGFNNLLTGTDASSIALNAGLIATPSALTVSTLSTASTLSAGQTVVSNSSGFIADFQSALSGKQSFSASGSLAGTTKSFADYATLIVAGVASRAESASTTYSNKQTAYQTLADRFSSQTGVNIDEETARISEYEQQYSTAAQLLAVLNDMFDALLAAVS